jgi:mRNA-degrading endonuclease RelE of RelBE toxin-antitoxin system
VKHFTTPDFWVSFKKLPESIQNLARKKYQLLNENPSHRSLQFKKVKNIRSVRIGIHYRALGIEADSDVVWFWIGTHADYDRLIS